MCNAEQTIVVIAGLGKFYGAGKRIFLSLKNLAPFITPILIDEKELHAVADRYGIDKNQFSAKHRGFGFWQWKPLLIYHFLQQRKFDKIIYIDAGCDVEPSSFKTFVTWFCGCKYGLLLTRTGHSIESYTKPSVIKALGNKEYEYSLIEMMQAGVIFLKTKAAISEIFEEAFMLIRNRKHDLYDDSEIEKYKLLKNDFIDHRHDQSVLSLIILNNRNLKDVGVLPTSMTPPQHLDWSRYPPIIASRNVSPISLYWPLLAYPSFADFPRLTKLEIRILSKLIRLARNSDILINLADMYFRVRYAKRKINTDLLMDENILRPPLHINEFLEKKR